jgi:hypothetical protein
MSLCPLPPTHPLPIPSEKTRPAPPPVWSQLDALQQQQLIHQLAELMQRIRNQPGRQEGTDHD